MNKKLWIGTIAVFIAMGVLSFIIHGVLLKSTYQSAEVMGFMRPEAEMMGMMWIFYVVNAVISFFFTLIFSKGYEGKGMGEGLRYGFYVGCLMATPMAYASYAMYPMPYSLALTWFICGIIEYLIYGAIVAMVFGSSKKEAAAA
jgi:hypothetical protein